MGPAWQTKQRDILKSVFDYYDLYGRLDDNELNQISFLCRS